MKHLLFAAAALLAVPALAQQTTTPDPGNQTGVTTGGAASTGTPSSDSSASADQSMSPSTTTTQQAPTTGGDMSAGGAMTTGGTQPTFGQPTDASPPPAPLAKYPICRKGQYDKCMQRGGR